MRPRKALIFWVKSFFLFYYLLTFYGLQEQVPQAFCLATVFPYLVSQVAESYRGDVFSQGNEGKSEQRPNDHNLISSS